MNAIARNARGRLLLSQLRSAGGAVKGRLNIPGRYVRPAGKKQAGKVKKKMDRETLRQYRAIELEIRQLERERLYWRELAGKCVRNPDSLGVKKSGHDPLPGIMDKLDEIGDSLGRRVGELCALRARIEAAVDGLEGIERVLMRSHYIENKTWQRVADELGYTWRWVNKLHDKALAKLENC